MASTRRLRRLRREVLAAQPLCQLKLPGCTQISTTVDHIYPVSEFPQLREAKANLQGSCWACNRRRGALPISALPERGRSPALSFFD